MTENKIELYSETEKDVKKVFIRNLHHHVEDMKTTIKNIEEKLNLKSGKRKVDSELECYFDCSDPEIIKEYLTKDLNIDEKNIKIVGETEKKEDDKKKEKEKMLLNKINKKISMQFIKEGNKNKTFLTNINIFLEKQELQIFCKKLQKILGSSSTINADGDCGFSGDYTIDTFKREIIKKFILDNTKITKEYIEF